MGRISDSRINIIGQNGNDGLHYEEVDKNNGIDRTANTDLSGDSSEEVPTGRGDIPGGDE